MGKRRKQTSVTSLLFSLAKSAPSKSAYGWCQEQDCALSPDYWDGTNKARQKAAIKLSPLASFNIPLGNKISAHENSFPSLRDCSELVQCASAAWAFCKMGVKKSELLNQLSALSSSLFIFMQFDHNPRSRQLSESIFAIRSD